MEKMYNVKGAGKLDKIGACNAMTKELLKIHEDCLLMLSILQGYRNDYPRIFQHFNVTPAEDELNPRLNRINAKMNKEKAFQQKIIENKDFDALVKDVNKTIRIRELFAEIMMNGIEQLTKNINAKNINDTFKIFYMKNKFDYKDKKDVDANVATEIKVTLDD